jgi:hypothetical protein
MMEGILTKTIIGWKKLSARVTFKKNVSFFTA